MKQIYDAATAVYANDEKTVIRVKLTEVADDGVEQVFHQAIGVRPSPLFDEFIKQVSLDQVEENTKKVQESITSAIVKEREDLIAAVKKEIGVAPAATETTSNVSILDMDVDSLFKIKLQVFEIEEIKESKNRALKAKIRKSKTFMETLANTVALILDSQNAVSK